MLMKVLLDATCLSVTLTGVGLYTASLFEVLSRFPECYFFFDRTGKDRLAPVPLPRERVVTIPSRRLPVGKRVPSGFLDRFDLFHSTNYRMPDVLAGERPANLRHVVTVYDLSIWMHPEFFTREALSYFQDVPETLKRADHLITISRAVREDLIRVFRIPEERTSMVYPGLDKSRFRPGEAGEGIILHQYRLRKPYVLFVGTLEPRKNVVRLVEAFHLIAPRNPDLTLVLAGQKGGLSGPIFQRIRDLGLENRVIHLGYAKAADLPALYVGASLFVYPSLYEGFGMPILEAMACDCPVIASSTSSLPEVAGDAALLVDPEKTDELAAAMEEVVTKPELSQRLREKGFLRASRFSWEEAARQTLDVYHRVIQGSGGFPKSITN